jgi:hypothetical protein
MGRQCQYARRRVSRAYERRHAVAGRGCGDPAEEGDGACAGNKQEPVAAIAAVSPDFNVAVEFAENMEDFERRAGSAGL